MRRGGQVIVLGRTMAPPQMSMSSTLELIHVKRAFSRSD